MVRKTKKKLAKRKTQKSKLLNRNTPVKKTATINNFSFLNNLQNFLIMLAKSPFIFINLLVNIIVKLLKSLIQSFLLLVRKIVFLFSGVKEAIFVLIFGFLAGCIGAVVAFSYLDFTSQNKEISKGLTAQNEDLLSDLNSISQEISSMSKEQDSIKETLKSVINLKEQFAVIKKLLDENNANIEITSKELKVVMEQTRNLSNNLNKLSEDLEENSKIMMSSSKSELSNRLYLAQSLLDRLKSGVPYAPQLIALGKEGLDPALLRFAKGGAPTLSDLAARLSVRAGELKDADKTKRDKNWRENLKKEITKFVKIKPTDINKISGTPGVLLRAEYAISNGNLDKAIDEINTLAPQERGVLNAWLAEAEATKNANIAAENLLTKTTAALQKRN